MKSIGSAALGGAKPNAADPQLKLVLKRGLNTICFACFAVVVLPFAIKEFQADAHALKRQVDQVGRGILTRLIGSGRKSAW